MFVGVNQANVGGCEQGYSKVKVGQCNRVNGTETGVELPSMHYTMVHLC